MCRVRTQSRPNERLDQESSNVFAHWKRVGWGVDIEIYALVAGTARCFGGARPSSMQKSNTGELGSLRGILAKIGEQRLPQFRLHEFGSHASVLCPHHPTQLIKPLKKMLRRKIVATPWEYMRWEEERYAHGGREVLSNHNKQASGCRMYLYCFCIGAPHVGVAS